ncbi:unannotated protein [freshwater metagenome]|uniref:Unannotated protein n=1 Tax=freshwater metagenome TaxID=449393 RepID=A0A6J7F776_9ZZZZ|nr:hypothetical protein [Actinomycetota bacterium]MSY82025.1 hypothetical protein [Actinomycetota bacterium]
MISVQRFLAALSAAVISLALIVVGPIIQAVPSFAATAGSAPCLSTVTDSSTVSVVYSSSQSKCYVIFKSGSNAWTAPSTVTSVDILVIAGGGAGGSGAWGGGGGAGGVVLDNTYTTTPSTSYSLTIGTGGTPGTSTLDNALNRSTNGADSWFGSNSTLVAKGGGAGASYAWGKTPITDCNGANGGSGGGATECNNAGNTNTGGTSTQTLPTGATIKYGNSGGGTPTANYSSGAGGGGSGAAGSAVTTIGTGANGGDGTQDLTSWITAFATGMSGVSGWSAATSNGRIAAGGGGAAGPTRGAPGLGGGGYGGDSTNGINGVDGVTNTGSGGGGGSYNGNTGTGGSGGSGLIVLRYTAAVATAVSIGLAGGVSIATYRAPIAITATLTGGNGKVRFYQDGKVIPGCQSITSSGLSATCMWRPASKRFITLTAELVASGAVLGSKSIPITVSIGSRSGKRS